MPIKRKLIVSIFDFPIPKGCISVPFSNPLAQIYKMAYHNRRMYPPDEYIMEYSPQEGFFDRHYRVYDTDLVVCNSCIHHLNCSGEKSEPIDCTCYKKDGDEVHARS